MLNLIDTPGHVDFSYEVSRSLGPVQGVLLLVDSSQGIEAQTVATYEMAILNDLKIIPILTKIDLPHSEPENKILELSNVFNFNKNEIIKTSSKTGIGINDVFNSIIDNIPHPNGNNNSTLIGLLYDSYWDQHRSCVIGLVYIKDGCLRTNDTIYLYHSNQIITIQECGIILPKRYNIDTLHTGQVGYIISRDMRDPSLIKIIS